jgi:O-antigen ligase
MGWGLLVVVLLGVLTGWLVVEGGILLVAALFCSLGYGFWALYDIEVAYAGVIGLVALLPFASLPFSIGFTPTFLDMALGMLFLTWMVPIALGREKRLIATPLGGPVLAFMLMAVGAFVAGLSQGALTSYLLRHFAEVLLSITLFYLVVNTVRDVGRLERLVRILILAAAAEALMGIVLYVLPDTLTITLLSALGRLKYPVGAGVLRFIRDDPALMQRATATSVDPNVLGSLLNVTLILTVPQLFAERPVLPRWLLVPIIGSIGVGLALTISRGSIGGAGLALLVIAGLRYRKLLPLMALAILVVLLLPWSHEYIGHFIEGLQGQDLSTQMRLGEYKDALILIRRYPLFGVGFAAAPDIDIYIGVANVYLLIAEQMGLIGLATYLVIIIMLFVRFWRHRTNAGADARLEPLWYGLHGAVIGGVTSGLLDHYFFSLDFHHSVTLFWLLIGLATAATELVKA